MQPILIFKVSNERKMNLALDGNQKYTLEYTPTSHKQAFIRHMLFRSLQSHFWVIIFNVMLNTVRSILLSAEQFFIMS